jgi:hypothetical protein
VVPITSTVDIVARDARLDERARFVHRHYLHAMIRELKLQRVPSTNHERGIKQRPSIPE